MEKVIKSLVVVAMVSLSSTSLFANAYTVQDTVVEDTVKKEIPAGIFLAADEVTYSKTEVAEVPQEVKSGIDSKYPGYAIEEAYKGSDESYKLILKKDETKLTVYYAKDGMFKKEETCSKTQDA